MRPAIYRCLDDGELFALNPDRFGMKVVDGHPAVWVMGGVDKQVMGGFKQQIIGGITEVVQGTVLEFLSEQALAMESTCPDCDCRQRLVFLFQDDALDLLQDLQKEMKKDSLVGYIEMGPNPAWYVFERDTDEDREFMEGVVEKTGYLPLRYAREDIKDIGEDLINEVAIGLAESC